VTSSLAPARSHSRTAQLVAIWSGLLLSCADIDDRTHEDAAGEVAEVSQAIQAGQRETGYPSVGMVVYGSEYCTGELVAPNVVLTAAHCYSDASLTFSTGSAPSNYVGRPLDSHVFHSSKDMMLIHLTSSIFDIDPIPLGTGALPSVGAICTAVGVGRHAETVGGVTSTVKQVKYSGTERVEASSSSNIVVVMDTGLADHGDSGGPLLCDGAISAITRGHSDGDWPAHARENYTPIDVPWITGTYSYQFFLQHRASTFSQVESSNGDFSMAEWMATPSQISSTSSGETRARVRWRYTHAREPRAIRRRSRQAARRFPRAMTQTATS